MRLSPLRLAVLPAVLAAAAAGAPTASAIVTGSGIRDSSITTLDIARDTLIGADIRTGAVGTLELAANAVRTSDILDQSIAMRDLGSNSVGSDEITAGAVRASELASNAVTRAELADDAVGADELAGNSVSGGHVAPNSIGAADIAVNGVGASEIATGGVTTAELLDGTIGTLDLALGAVTPERLAAAPSVALTFTAAQAIPANAATMVLPAGGWGEALDVGDMHDDAADPAYVVAPIAGWYQVSGRLEWVADAVGAAQDRRLAVMTSTSTGTDVRAAARVQDRPLATETQLQSVDGVVRLVAGDRIWLEAQQANTGDEPIAVSADVSTDVRGAAFRVVWIGA